MYIRGRELAAFLDISRERVNYYARQGMPRYRFPVYKGFQYFYLYQECHDWLLKNGKKRGRPGNASSMCMV